jgi:iron(III) transport system substrate-binding protein
VSDATLMGTAQTPLLERRLRSLLLPLCAALLASAGCGGGGGESATQSPNGEMAETAEAGQERQAGPPIVLYSGRSEDLVGPLLERFTQSTGTIVSTRYGDTAELAVTLMEEGERTPADAFLSQDGTALAALGRAHLLRRLPDHVLERVPAALRSPDGEWMGVAGRARVVVYNPSLVGPDDLPQRLEDVAEARYRGRFGIAPTNASLQAQLAAYAALEGLPALDRLLQGIAANEPRIYQKNGPIVDAVIAGEIDWGLVNHYYLWRVLRENPQAPGRNFYMPGGGAGGFVNVAGIALVGGDDAALSLAEYLVSEEAQRYFVDETFELPLVPGIEPPAGLPAIEGLSAAEIDWAKLADMLEPTLERIHASELARFR